MRTWVWPCHHPPTRTLVTTWESIAIGSGTFLVGEFRDPEGNLITWLRLWGHWEGELIIRDCISLPAGGRPQARRLIGGYRLLAQHDWLTLHIACTNSNITNLQLITDTNLPGPNQPAILRNFNRGTNRREPTKSFPYQITNEVIA